MIQLCKSANICVLVHEIYIMQTTKCHANTNNANIDGVSTTLFAWYEKNMSIGSLDNLHSPRYANFFQNYCYFSYYATKTYVVVLIRSTLLRHFGEIRKKICGYPSYLEIWKSWKKNKLVSLSVFFFVLRFYSLVNPLGSCQAWSVYLTMHFPRKA